MPQIDPLRATAEIIIKAVHDGDGTKVTAGVQFYEELVAAFVEEVRGYGVVFNEQVLSQDLLGWTTFNDISGQIRDFFDAAVESSRVDFVRAAERLCYRLANYGIDQREYLSFKTAIGLLTSVFWRTRDATGRLREYGREHTRQLIKDIVRFKLEPALRESSSGDRDQLTPFVKVVLAAYQDIMVWGVEIRDMDLFNLGLSDADSTMRWGRHDDSTDTLAVLADEINTYELRELRQLVKLGAGIRLILALEQGIDPGLKPIASALLDSLPPGESLTPIVLKALEGDVGHVLGWDWWELKPDEVVAVRTQQLLANLYVIASLRTEIPSSLPHGERSRDLLAAARGVRAEVSSPVYQFLFDALKAIPAPHKISKGNSWTHRRVCQIWRGLSRRLKESRSMQSATSAF